MKKHTIILVSILLLLLASTTVFAAECKLGIDVIPNTNIIYKIFEGTPAAGQLKIGDVISRVNGKSVGTYAELVSLISNIPCGEWFTMTILRNGTLLEIKIKKEDYGAQNSSEQREPVRQNRTIGVVIQPLQDQVDENTIDIPIDKWLNQSFIALEKPTALQKYGYQGLYYADRTYPSPSYQELVGKTLRAVKIEENSSEYYITFEEQQSGKFYKSPRSYKGHLSDLALLKDLDRAKKQWLGKTIYSKQRFINTYDQTTGKYGKIPVLFGEPLKVIDIWWGFDSTTPLWIIVETKSGQQGFIESAYSWTNIYRDWWKPFRPWEKHFSEINPRDVYDWGEEIWELINQEKVRIGMNKEQAELSWGTPKKINKDIYGSGVKEQWVYDGGYLYFEEETLIAIQAR